VNKYRNAAAKSQDVYWLNML